MKSTSKFYDAVGNETLVEKDACAKVVTYGEAGLVQYFVKYINGGLYNPRDAAEASRRMTMGIKFRKTNELTFLLYTKFLRTRNNSALLQAQREMGGR